MNSLSKEERQLLEEKYNGVMSEDFERDKQRLSKGEPLAYVIGWQPFLGLKIFLDSRPLIPRPETEWWVEELIGRVSSENGYASSPRQGDVLTLVHPAGAAPDHAGFRSAKDSAHAESLTVRAPFSELTRPLRVLDLCAGSGAIGCAVLKHVPNAEVSYGEIDPSHLPTIEKNIRENNLDAARAEARAGNLFEPFQNEKFSIIVTNPPYVPDGRTLDATVIEHEPPQALFAGEDGLALIRKIAKEAPAHLLSDGELWMECDSAHAETACALVLEDGATRAEIRNDHYGRPRLIVGYYS